MAFTCTGTQYASITSALATAAPCTMACWVQLTSTSVQNNIMGIASNTTDSFFALSGDEVTTAELSASAGNNAGTIGSSTGSTPYSTNTWFHACAVFLSTTSRTVYTNGTAATANTTSIAPASLGNTAIGGLLYNASISDEVSGIIAFSAFWNVALAAADVAALAAGASPRLVQPGALTSYARLKGAVTNESDLILPAGWTVTGTSTAGLPPRIYFP
jgi:Concanavalin A-like lectin/glucanases superfamily